MMKRWSTVKLTFAQARRALTADRAPLAGWAASSLARSIGRIALVAAAGWQPVMVFAVSMLTSGTPAVLLAAGAIAVAAGALAMVARTRTVAAWTVPVAMASLGVAGYFVSGDVESALSFASCWQINFATCIAGLLVRSRWVVAATIAASTGIGIAVGLGLPHWGTQLATVIPITQTSIIVAMRLGLPLLFTLAARADAEEAAFERTRERLEVTTRVSVQIAEEARVLHDTVINTLGAIASGTAARIDQVRSECARNAATLRDLSRGRFGVADFDDAMRDVLEYPGIPVRRVGIDGALLAEAVRGVAPDTLAGMVAAAREAVINANKHASASHIEIALESVGAVFGITVRDDGVGFDPERVELRGVTDSIFGRAELCGFTAELTSRIGDGTSVVLTAVPRDTHEVDDTDETSDGVRSVVDQLHRQAGLLWAAGVTLVSAVITFGGVNEYGALYAMLGVMMAAWMTGYIASTSPRRRFGVASAAAVVGLPVATAAVFLLSAAATGFGTTGAVHWHALAATGPAVLFLSRSTSPRRLIGIAAVFATSVVVVAAAVWPFAPTGAAIVLIAGSVAGVFCAVWVRFMRLVESLSLAAASAQRRIARARRTMRSEQAAQRAYQRWVAGGIDSGVRLLEGIGDGTLDPRASEVRDACGREERLLRQIVLISPEQVHLGAAIIPVLRHAHERGVELTVRLGGRDAADEKAAGDIVASVSSAISDSCRGDQLSVSIFPVHEGLRLTLIGRRDGAPASAQVIEQLTWPIHAETGAPEL